MQVVCDVGKSDNKWMGGREWYVGRYTRMVSNGEAGQRIIFIYTGEDDLDG